MGSYVYEGNDRALPLRANLDLVTWTRLLHVNIQYPVRLRFLRTFVVPRRIRENGDCVPCEPIVVGTYAATRSQDGTMLNAAIKGCKPVTKISPESRVQTVPHGTEKLRRRRPASVALGAGGASRRLALVWHWDGRRGRMIRIMPGHSSILWMPKMEAPSRNLLYYRNATYGP